MSKPAVSAGLAMPMEALAPLVTDCVGRGQTVVLPITGTSMTPFLRPDRDRVVLGGCAPAALKKGAVPLYRRRDGRYVLHRIVGRTETAAGVEYTLLGDAQWVREPHIEPDQILACAVAFEVRGKQVPCTALRYRLRVWLWNCLRPVRRWLMPLWRRMYAKKK